MRPGSATDSTLTAALAGERDGLVTRSVAEILSLTRLLTLATVSPEGLAHVNIAFYAFDPSFTLYVLSPPQSEHARNLVANPSAAATVFDSTQDAPPRRGLQLFGRMSQLDGEDALHAHRVFTARFADIAEAAPTYEHVLQHFEWRLFGLVPDRVKAFDEVLLDQHGYVEVGVGSSELHR